MTRRCLAVAAKAMMFVTIASAQDAKTVVANAQKAMGYENLKTIQYSGPLAHEGAGLGQWISPTKGWHHNTVRDYTRFIDLTAGTSMRNGTSKREGDPATGLLPGGGGLDPSAAPAVAGTTNIAADAAFAAKLDMTLSPPVFLKNAAAASNATVRNQGRYKVVSFESDQKAPSGVAYKYTGYINNQNILEKVETAYEDNGGANGYLFGDILVEQNFLEYKDFAGVKFPTRITQNRAGVLYSDATVADVKANVAAPAAIPPAAGGGRGAGGGAPGAPGAGAGAGGRGGDAAAAGGRGAGGGAPGAPGAPGAAAAGGRGAGGGAPGGGAPGAGGGRGGDGAAAGGRGGGAPGAPGAPPAGGAQAAGGRGGAGGGAAAAPAGPRKIAEGVFVITNNYRTLAIEMKDGIVLLDAPQNGTAANIAQAKEAIPNKPITHVITTHMHFDHVAGLRTILADGPKEVTLVTNDMNKAVVEKWFSNPRTLQANVPAGAAPAAPAPAPAAGGRGGAAPAPWPDALAQSGKKVKFQYVKDKWTLKDATRTIEVYAIKGALHGEDMMVVYLPKEKVIFEADAYNPGAVGAVTNPTTNGGQLAFQKLLASELDRLKLDYTTIVSGHAPAGGGARDATKQDLMVAIGRVPPPAPATPAVPVVPAAPGGGRGQ